MASGKGTPYAADPVVGFDPGLGVYVTKSGKNLTRAQYTALTGKPATPVGKSPPTDFSVPAAPVGRGADLGHPAGPGSFWRLPVLSRQQALRDAGYNVAVDGAAGPQTFTASKAYVKGIPASYWNHAWAASHAAAVDTSPSGTDASTGGAVTAPTPAPPRTPAAATGGPAANPLQQLLQMVLSGSGAYKAPTAADMLTLAQKQADVSLAPYKAELERQQTQATNDANARAAFQGNLASALAEVLKSQGPATQGAYEAFGNDTAAAAKGFSTDLADRATANANDTNAFLRSIGADPRQLLDTSKGAAGADVAYGLGGYIPASTMAREGAAFTGAANLLPQTATGQGAQLASQELAAGAKTKSDLAQQLLDLQLQRPKLVQDSIAQQQDSALKGAAAAQNQALLPILLAKDFEGMPGVNPLTGAKTKTQVGIDLQVGDQTIRLKQLDLTTRKTLASLTGVDPTTGAPTPETQRLLLAEWKAKNPAAKGGFTAHEISDLRAKAGAIAHDAFYGVPGDAKHDALPPLTYQDAMREILNAGVPLSEAQKALNSFWTQPGRDRAWEKSGDAFTVTGFTKSAAGRPVRPFQIRVRSATRSK